MTGSFTPRPRIDPRSGARSVDRWPAIEAGLLDLLSECSQIELLPPDLSLAAVRRTRKILSHDYRAARKDIVWDVIEQRIPQVIVALVR